MIIKTENLTRLFQVGSETIEALKGIDLSVKKGEFVSIMGPSGSGKTTLMNIIGCLDTPSAGTYYLNNKLVNELNDDDLAAIRNSEIGFVFQSFNLINYKNALENVVLPLYYQGMPRKEREEKALNYLDDVGLKEWATHLPTELSGGQKQRVAIARAMVGEPKVLLADEPTGALDSKTSKEVMDLIQKINKAGKTILVVTHEQDIAEMCSRIVKLKDGVIVEDKKIRQKKAL